MLNELKEIEEKMDLLNGNYGDKNNLCIYCHSKHYSANEGIIHYKTCAIRLIRNQIEQLKREKVKEK